MQKKSVKADESQWEEVKLLKKMEAGDEIKLQKVRLAVDEFLYNPESHIVVLEADDGTKKHLRIARLTLDVPPLSVKNPNELLDYIQKHEKGGKATAYIIHSNPTKLVVGVTLC